MRPLLHGAAASLLDTLSGWAEIQPEKVAYVFLADGETATGHLTYGALDMRARAIAFQLQSLGATRKPVLLLYPAGLEFVCGFMGCSYAGAIAVPVPHTSRGFTRALGIAKDAEPCVVLTTGSLLSTTKTTLADLSAPPHYLASDTLSPALAVRWKNPGLTSGELAFLQYTSGSTGEPRGVMVSHGNVLHNLDSFRHALATRLDILE